MELAFGSSFFTDASDVILVDGARLFAFTAAPGDGKVLPDVDIWDGDGKRVAKLRHGAWAFHDDSTTIKTHPDSLTLTQGEKVLFECRRSAEGPGYWVRQMDLWTRNGVRVVIAPAGGDIEFRNQDGDRIISFERCTFEGRFTGFDIIDNGEERVVVAGDRVILPKQALGARISHGRLIATP